MYIIGMISGTSADGIDAGLIEIDGTPPTLQVRVQRHKTFAYDPAVRTEIFAAFRPESSSADRLCRLNVTLGEFYASVALALLEEARITPEQVDLIASHGQAIWYEPPTGEGTALSVLGSVLTMGEPAVIAERTGITTLGHIRARDLAAGGRGAPLVAYLDWLLFRSTTQARAIQNIGGIGNVAGLPPLGSETPPLAFDTGPGNMLIDYCTTRATNGALAFDLDGQIAARGRIHEPLLAELMTHPYIQQQPPKTTGRELFGAQFGAEIWKRGDQLGLSGDDLIATVTAFTAESIAYSCRKLIPFSVTELFIAGGGASNPTLCAMIQARLPGVTVHLHDELGVPSAAKECVLMAVIGYEAWHGRPGALPVFTGAKRAAILGSFNPGRAWPPPQSN